jgi:hypothetical protein
MFQPKIQTLIPSGHSILSLAIDRQGDGGREVHIKIDKKEKWNQTYK